jgi:hypothetical protein
LTKKYLLWQAISKTQNATKLRIIPKKRALLQPQGITSQKGDEQKSTHDTPPLQNTKNSDSNQDKTLLANQTSAVGNEQNST